MKNLMNYIQEVFRINQDNKPEQTEYKYFPKDKRELKPLIRKRLSTDENANLNDIDVSKVDNMSYLFFQLDPHNIDISEWDVSNVENMHAMFASCENFNCDLSDWDVSKAKNMYDMFCECKNFEGKGLENWNVSNVEDMRDMFYKCYSLKNKPSWYKP